jgi:hypothetical protein
MLGALASAAPSIVGAIGGYNDAKKARRAHDRARNRGDDILGVWDEHDQGGEYGRLKEKGGLFGVRREYMQKLLENAQGAFTGAKQSARRGAKSARNTARATGKQMQADAAQSLQDRGLFGSTIGQQAQSGISYRTGQALSDIDAQLGQLLGDIELEESSVMDQVLRGNLALEEMNAEQMMAYIVANTGHGAGDTSMFFSQAPSEHAQTQKAFDPFSAGAGVEAGIDFLKGLF